MMDVSNGHIQSYKHLLAVLAGLLALTGVTVAVSRVELGGLNIWIAIVIASIKSTFVLLFFMNLRYEGRLIRNTFLSTVSILALLVGFLFWDVAFR
jgi:cytochrome c oxidase subunit 4